MRQYQPTLKEDELSVPAFGNDYTKHNQNYNRYVFTGKNRIDREDMDDDEEEIMRAFDILCFKGNYHMKRGHGLSAFPPVLLYRIMPVIDLVQFVYNMFDKRNLLTKKQEI